MEKHQHNNKNNNNNDNGNNNIENNNNNISGRIACLVCRAFSEYGRLILLLFFNAVRQHSKDQRRNCISLLIIS